jgi:hypothetical protein
MLQVDKSETKMHETDEPNSVVGFLDAEHDANASHSST